MAPILTERSELRRLLDDQRAAGRTVGLIGTSGGLHDGHLSLIRRSAAAGDLTLVWLFTGRVPIATGVMPSYPRDYERDQDVAAAAGASLVFRPSNEALFADGPPLVRVSVDEQLATPWAGSDSDVFVNMVATVMAKALNVVGPCRLYCGEKDWQNVVVFRRMVTDLSMAVDVVACPSVRESDGLVFGSRNAKLTADERTAATAIKPALDAAATMIATGTLDAAPVEAALRDRLESVGKLEYAVVVDADTLQTVRRLDGNLRILVSVGFSQTNLMDNVGVTVGTAVPHQENP